MVISRYQRAQSCTWDQSSSTGFDQILVFPLLAENLRNIRLGSSATSASLGSWLKVSFALCRVWSPSTATSRESGISLVKCTVEQLWDRAAVLQSSSAQPHLGSVADMRHKKKILKRSPRVFVKIQNLFKYTHTKFSLSSCPSPNFTAALLMCDVCLWIHARTSCSYWRNGSEILPWPVFKWERHKQNGWKSEFLHLGIFTEQFIYSEWTLCKSQHVQTAKNRSEKL